MADENNAFRIRKGRLVLEPLATPVLVEEGAVAYDSDDSKLKLRDDVGTKALVTETGTATLTNKTIDADVNTITDLANASIKVGAAIDVTKLADGSVTNTEFQYLDGLTGNIQDQIDDITIPALPEDNVLIGNASGDATAVDTAVLGDIEATVAGGLVIKTGVIVNADINASAGIDATKIADGSVSNTEFQYLDGLTGNIQDQIDDIGVPVLPENNVFIGDATNDAVAVDTDVVGDIQATVAGGLAIKAGAIVDADINASAAIDASKLANGTVSNTEFQYLDGVTSSIQTQFTAKVTGPASATDNAAVRFDGTTGKLVQDSTVTISDLGAVAATSFDTGSTIIENNEITVDATQDLNLRTSADGNVTIYGGLALPDSNDASTGNVDALNTSSKPSIRLTGAVTALRGLANGFPGKLVYVVNTSGGSLTVSNENATPTAANRIITGTGADLTMANGSVLAFKYDSTTSRWRISGGSGGGGGGGGDVVGPASATDNALARFDSTTGKLIQNSVAVLSDAGTLTGVTQMDIDALRFDQAEIAAIGADQSIYISPTGTGTVVINNPVQIGENPAPTVDGSYGAWYTGQDKRPYFKNDAQSEFRLDKTQVINYIGNGDAEGDQTTGWAVYADAAGAAPVNGTGGSANVTISTSSTAPLRGSYDFNLAKDAANRQGQGWSYDFSISNADAGKVQQISFDYEVVLGTYVTSDVTVWIYDVTNSVVIQPAPSSIENIVGPGRWQGTFQAASNSTSYRLIWHVSSVSAIAYTLAVDNVVVGPQIITQGTPVSDYASYTATLTNLGTATQSLQWRRVGDSIEIKGRVTIGATTPTGTLTISLPAGLSFSDSANIAAGFATGSKTTFPMGSATILSSTTFGFFNQAANAAWNATNPFTWAAADYFEVNINAKITGWSSQVQMSSEADVRVVAARYASSAGQSIANGAGAIVNFGTKTFDTHNAVTTGGGWNFRAPVSGIYRISTNIRYANGLNWTVGSYAATFLYKNGALFSNSDTAIQVTAAGLATGPGNGFCTDVEMIAGDTLDIRTAHGESSARALVAATGLIWVAVERLSGPSQIAATETIVARYCTGSGQSIANGATAIIDFNTKTIDSLNSVTTGASWKFTVPVAGKYKVYTRIRYANSLAWTQSTSIYCQLYKNGSAYSVPVEEAIQTSYTAAIGPSASGEDIVDCIAGDTLDIRASHYESTARALFPVATYNYITIVRVGN